MVRRRNPNRMRLTMRYSLLLLWLGVALSVHVGTLRVCTHKSCRKAGSVATLTLLRELASTAAPTPTTEQPLTAALLQEAFADACIESCGCLGACGSGPNVATHEHVFHDVYKPISALALVNEELGLSVPDSAAAACLKRMYAERAMRENKMRDALGLITAALNHAGTLGIRAAYLIHQLLQKRADVHALMGDPNAAADDRAAAQRMMERRLTVGEEGAARAVAAASVE